MKATQLKTIIGAMSVFSLVVLPLAATSEYTVAVIPDGITCATPPETPSKKELPKKTKPTKKSKKNKDRGKEAYKSVSRE